MSTLLAICWCFLYCFSLPPGLSLLLRSSCSITSAVSCLFSPFLSSIPPSVSLYLPPPLSPSPSLSGHSVSLSLSVGLMWDWLSSRIQPSSKAECGWMRASHWGSNLALVNEPPFPPSSSSSSSHKLILAPLLFFPFCPPPLFLTPTSPLFGLSSLLLLLSTLAACSWVMQLLPLLYHSSTFQHFNSSFLLLPLSALFPSPSALHQPQSFLRLSSKPRLASVSLCPTSPSSSNHHHGHRTDDTYTLSLWTLTLITTCTAAAHLCKCTLDACTKKKKQDTGGKLASCCINAHVLVNTHTQHNFAYKYTWIIYHSTFGSVLL